MVEVVAQATKLQCQIKVATTVVGADGVIIARGGRKLALFE